MRAIMAGTMLAIAIVIGGAAAEETTPSQTAGVAAAEETTPSQTAGVAVTPAMVEAAIAGVDGLVADVMERTGVPGIAVAVVADGKVALARGYGVLEAGKPAPVDADSVFQLASVSKSVGSTVVASQVGRSVLWDTPVTRILPWFALSDPRATEMVTIGDLYSHRSGLPDHAGDDIEDLGYDRRAVLERLRFLPLEAFRDSYAYTNFGLTAAAEAVAVAAGTDWETLSETAIYRPLGMTRTSSRFADYIARDNRAVPHMRDGGGWAPLEQRQPDPQSPAGGVSSSAADMARWMLMVLGGGRFEGREIVPLATLLPAISPHAVSAPPYAPDARAEFYGYGFGVNASATGRVELSHSGGFYLGAGTVFRMVPSLGVGIVVLSNAQPIGAVEAIALSFSDLLERGAVSRDWWAALEPRLAPLFAPAGHLAAAGPPADPAPAQPLAAYAGAYRNDYFGPVEVAEEEGALVLRAGPAGTGFRLSHWSGDSFVLTPVGENAPAGSRSEVSFRFGPAGAEAVTVEAWDGEGLGTFIR